MPQDRLGNDAFLTQLSSLLSSKHSASHGSVFLTQKSLTTKGTDESLTPSESLSQVLIRASNGVSNTKPKPGVKVEKKPQKERIRLATVVDMADLDSFYAKYAEVCKKGMEGLRKRDKKKAKEKAKAKKKGKGQGQAP